MKIFHRQSMAGNANTENMAVHSSISCAFPQVDLRATREKPLNRIGLVLRYLAPLMRFWRLMQRANSASQLTAQHLLINSRFLLA